MILLKKVSILAVGIICLTASAIGQDKIDIIEIASGFNIPVGILNAGDDRLFIIEKTGYIRIMDTLGQVNPEPFLDIDARVNSGASERGLLGLAFHPNYTENGYFYVNYSNSAGSTVIARFSRDPDDPDKADPDSEMILLTQSQPFQNHNGGHLAFGPDGYLYIGLGDGGSGGDPGDRAQNLETLLGKMLRIDVDGEEPYAIPSDNPYMNTDTALAEIWASGLRNPWRYSFDRLTGDLWIADVGQDAWEEIDFQPQASTGGENYGWRCKEGLVNFNTTGCPGDEAFTPPVHVYAHVGQSCSGSVTGGYVYRGSKHPYLYGKYIYTDYCRGVFGSILINENETETETLADLQNGEFTAFGEDASGELYLAGGSGRIYSLISLVSGTKELSLIDARISPNPASGRFTIDIDNNGSLTVDVFNTAGTLMLSKQVTSGQSIDCNSLREGLYMVRISLPNGGFAVEKLTVIR